MKPLRKLIRLPLLTTGEVTPRHTKKQNIASEVVRREDVSMTFDDGLLSAHKRQRVIADSYAWTKVLGLPPAKYQAAWFVLFPRLQ